MGRSLRWSWLAPFVGRWYSWSAIINTWSNLVRGVPISIQPHIDRSILRAQVPPIATFQHAEYDPPPSSNNHNQNPKSQSTQKTNDTVTFQITLDQLKTLRDKVERVGSTTRYSTYEILVVHIWLCACKARGLADDQATRHNIGVNGRLRFSPPLPEAYFGNAIFPVRPIALAKDLQTELLMDTVERVHEAIKKMNNEYLRSVIDYLEQHSNLEGRVPRQGNRIYGCPNLNVVNWMRLPIHDADFGWGRPAHMGLGSVYLEGLSVLLPSPTNNGSFCLVICLEADHMQHFNKLFNDFV